MLMLFFFFFLSSSSPPFIFRHPSLPKNAAKYAYKNNEH